MPYWITWLVTTYNDGLNVKKNWLYSIKTMFGFIFKYLHNFSTLYWQSVLWQPSWKNRSHLEAWNDEYNLSWSFYANILAWQRNKTAFLYVWKQTFYKVSCIYFHLAAILKKPVAILKMEKSKMANEKFLTRKVQRTNSERLTLVSISAWFSWKICPTRFTNYNFGLNFVTW